MLIKKIQASFGGYGLYYQAYDKVWLIGHNSETEPVYIQELFGLHVVYCGTPHF